MAQPKVDPRDAGQRIVPPHLRVTPEFYGVAISEASLRVRTSTASVDATENAALPLVSGARADDMAWLLNDWFEQNVAPSSENRPVVVITGSDIVQVQDVTRSFRDASKRCVADVDLPAAVKSFTFTELDESPDPVLVVDLGKRGTSAYLVGGGTSPVVVPSERITNFGGDVIDEIVRRRVVSTGAIAWPPPPEQLTEYRSFFRSVKEQLTNSKAVRLPDGGPTLITRAQFDQALHEPLMSMVTRIDRFAITAGLVPVSVVLIGGGAVIPAIGRSLSSVLSLPVKIADDAVGALARGAAYIGSRTHPEQGCAACA